MAKKKLPPDLLKASKLVKGRVKVLSVLPYEGINVYIRQIDLTMFEYLFSWKGEVWNAYIVMPPEKGKSTYTQKQLNAISSILYAGAHATIENLLGLESEEIEQQKALGEVVVKAGEKLQPEKLVN